MRVWTSVEEVERAANAIVVANKSGHIPEELLRAHKYILQMMRAMPDRGVIISRYYEIIAERDPSLIEILGNP